MKHLQTHCAMQVKVIDGFCSWAGVSNCIEVYVKEKTNLTNLPPCD